MSNVLFRVHAKVQEKFKQMEGPRELFFSQRRFETAELRKDLQSSSKHKQKAAVKCIIASMVLGTDVSAVFVDVVKLGRTENLELKKLVYLYIIHTAKMQPDTALLAVNTFLVDAQSKSPLVRALAIRAMMCIRVQSVLEYTVDALWRACGDSHPYVRKAVAMGIGKLYHHNPNLFRERGFLDQLRSPLLNSEPNLLGNAAAVLLEIYDYGGNSVALADIQVLKLVKALESANEWEKTYILDLIAELKVSNGETAEAVVNYVMPYLNHFNAAVVLGSIKVVAHLASRCSSSFSERINHRISIAISSLSQGDPETQYITFKNIHLLIVIFPNLLRNDLKCFFVRYHDPPYVKMEKLQLLLKLVTPATAQELCNEFKNYAKEVDQAFLEKLVHAVASLAIKIEKVAKDCADLFLLLLQRHRSLLFSIVIATRHMLIKYPDLLDLNKILDFQETEIEEGGDSEAKVALFWLVGEYCDQVNGGREILDKMSKRISALEPSVQVALLTALVKVTLRDGSTDPFSMETVFHQLTALCVDPDTRDRAIGYQRLLSKGFKSEEILSVLCEANRQPINVDTSFSDAMTLKDVKKSINTAAAVYGRPYASFVRPYGWCGAEVDDEENEMSETECAVNISSHDASASRESTGVPRVYSEATETGALSPVSPMEQSYFTPASEEAFLDAWGRLGDSTQVSQRDVRVSRELGEADPEKVTAWLEKHGFVVACSIKSQRTIYMASIPSLDPRALVQIIIQDPLSTAPTTVIVKGERAPQLVHVLAIQLEKIQNDLSHLLPAKSNQESLIDRLFS